MTTTSSPSFLSYYSVENEEKYLASYLQRNTAINVTKETSSQRQRQRHITVDDVITLPSSSDRVYCCNTSRSLYCPECYSCLVPKMFWPRRFIQQQQLNYIKTNGIYPFPFKSMDIILGVKERRSSSTGIQLMSICKMISDSDNDNDNAVVSLLSSSRNNSSDAKQQQGKIDNDDTIDSYNNNNDDANGSGNDNGNGNEKNVDGDEINDYNTNKWWENVNLYDLNREDVLPQYTAHYDKETTFVLFPQEGKSVAIHTVAKQIKKLIILDIKWTRSANILLFNNNNNHKTTRNNIDEKGKDKHSNNNNNNNNNDKQSYNDNPLSSLEGLQFVHLEFPPRKSYFWRWHNRGDGMLSTIEAVYFAAREVSAALEENEQNDENDEEGNNRISQQAQLLEGLYEEEEESISYRHQRCSYTNILWLFALQRSIIEERSVQEGRSAAFSEEAKAYARSLRKKEFKNK